jgi:hypothetical protein
MSAIFAPLSCWHRNPSNKARGERRCSGEVAPDRCRARLAGSLQSFRSRKRYGCVDWPNPDARWALLQPLQVQSAEGMSLSLIRNRPIATAVAEF